MMTAAGSVQTAVVNCPKTKVGRIIGKQGETIKALQNYTGAMIQIDQSSDPTRVTVAGSLQSLSLAVSMIQDIVEGHFKGFAMLRQVSGSKDPNSELPGSTDAAGQPQPVYVEGYGFVPPSQLCNTEGLLGPALASTTGLQDRSASQSSSRGEPGLLWQALNDCPKGFSPELLLQSLAALQVDTQQQASSRPSSADRGSPELLTPHAMIPSVRTRSPSPPSSSSLWGGGTYLPVAASTAQLGRNESFGRNESRGSAESTYDPAPASVSTLYSGPADLTAISAAQASSLFQSALPLKGAAALMPGSNGMVSAPNGHGLLDPMPAGWIHVRDPDGRPFFFNSLTGISQWETPTISAIASAGLSARHY